jgi:hypothetical protein
MARSKARVSDPTFMVPAGTPPDVEVRDEPRVPEFDPTAGVAHDFGFPHDPESEPPHRLVVIGDSLSHGFQSGAIYNTDISYPAIVAYELGWFDHFRFPRYGGPGGLPLNVEYLLRDLERRYEEELDWWELPGAAFHARNLMDEIEDYWERGPGSVVPKLTGVNHNLGIYGWDLRDALERTYNSCSKGLAGAKDDALRQIVERNGERAALRVYPSEPEALRDDTVFDAAARLGAEGPKNGHGIETLVVFLGANNALQTVTKLQVSWSKDPGYQDLSEKRKYTVWTPTHFSNELDAVVAQVEKINARHVIWCTVPHVTVAPIARGIGDKMRPGSRYFNYYTRPWVETSKFQADRDPCISGDQARVIDSAIDQYNDAIVAKVKAARGRSGGRRDWYVLDVAGLLDRMASRRYIEDFNARPAWWTPYPLPAPVAALKPTIDSRFLASDGKGGRDRGGLFSLDGVHPTTVANGLIAQELIDIMRRAGVVFRSPDNTTVRTEPVSVDFERLIRRDSLIKKPPQNLSPGLKTLGWADEALDFVKRALDFGT